MQYLSVRNVPPELAAALKKEKARQGKSLNRTIIDLLRQSLGVGRMARRSNGLARLAGSWSDEDLRRFEDAVAATEEIDEELWK